MDITKEQWDKVVKLNDSIKDLDPILKEKLIEIELCKIFQEDYLKTASLKKGTQNTGQLKQDYIEPKEIANQKDSSRVAASLRDFYNEKKPSTELETVTVFGFYLEHFNKISEFTEKDIAGCYFEARARKPKVIGQALRDAKNSKHYLVEGSKKGKFRISNTGENLVLHDLPKEKKVK